MADRAANRAEEALAVVGAMQSDWNRIVADNRYLESRLDAADALIADLTQLVLALADRR